MAQYEDEFEKLHKEHLLILSKLGTIITSVSLILREMQKFSTVRFDYTVGPITTKQPNNK